MLPVALVLAGLRLMSTLLVQVPSPLTDDMESARKEKLNEKKKAQKRAKKLKEVNVNAL